ncbi:MAG: phosphodiesterase [Proteobacteria bacterium]|nr:MAG: phosphodiesterase [Pseudomonadota bacterium]
MLIAQVTDPHIKAEGKLAYRKVDTAANLSRCVDHLLRIKQRPDCVLMTGDLTDFGRPDEYRLLRELLASLEMPIYVIPGNHDERENFRRAFSSHPYIPREGDIRYVVDDYPLRMIGLDSTIPGKPGGEMSADRLDWLDRQLRARPEVPTLLFMHHPPIITGIAHMDVQNCANAEGLGDLLEGHPQVFQILCGHVHRPIQTVWRGVNVAIAPSASHYVALDLGNDSPREFFLEPPSVFLHYWNEGSLVTHLSFVGEFDGPYPFFDEYGNLID